METCALQHTMDGLRMRESKSALVRRKELIEYFGIHDSTLWRWRQSKSFPKEIRLGTNTIAWERAAIAKWMEERSQRN